MNRAIEASRHAVTDDADPLATAWLDALWSDPARPADVRVPAALAWFCLTDGPVPDDLRTTVGALVTDDLARVLDDVPWFWHVDQKNGPAETLHQMLNGPKPRTGPAPSFWRAGCRSADFSVPYRARTSGSGVARGRAVSARTAPSS
ncbi:hypothetical protein [Kitasatospora sp. NPDC089509]|uniref:hypothetical protein n=1 Tax=Kitasatospora sp. NPDC089509 TaxID=3364079 RepID=UPI003806DF11